MGNIHLGKEITVINLQEALGDPYSGMKAIADDLKVGKINHHTVYQNTVY